MPVSLGTAFRAGIGGFNTLAAIVTSQAGILPIHFGRNDAPLVIVGIIGMLVCLSDCRLHVCALRAKDTVIRTKVIKRISTGPRIGGQVAVIIALRFHSAPPFCASMPAFKILSAAAKIRCALRSGMVPPCNQL
jgi:hypothetical protein